MDTNPGGAQDLMEASQLINIAFMVFAALMSAVFFLYRQLMAAKEQQLQEWRERADRLHQVLGEVHGRNKELAQALSTAVVIEESTEDDDVAQGLVRP